MCIAAKTGLGYTITHVMQPWPGSTPWPATMIGGASFTSGGSWITLNTPSGGDGFTYPILATVDPGVSQNFTIQLTYFGTCDYYIQLKDGSTSTTLATHTLSGSGFSGSVTIPVTPTSSSMTLEITTPLLGSGCSLDISEIDFDTVTYTTTMVTTTICNEDGYEYGYNGQMKVNDWAGLGNHYQFKAREFDARTCRFISVDPLTKKYPWYSSYQFAGNTPIQAKDLEGLKPAVVNGQINWGYFWGKIGVRGNDEASAKDWANKVIVPAAKEVAKQTVSFLLLATPGLEEVGLEEEAAMFVADETRVEAPMIETEVNLQSRAQEIHSTLDPIAQSKRTTAVADATTAEGNSTTLVASSRNSLSPVQKAALKPGEVPVSGEGHAEAKILEHAKTNNMKVNNVAASRPICNNCADAIQSAGAKPASPIKSTGQQVVPIDNALPGK